MWTSRCDIFGEPSIPNRYRVRKPSRQRSRLGALVTTYGGGPSNILVWEYNSQHKIKAAKQAKTVVEKYGEWSPYSAQSRAVAPSP